MPVKKIVIINRQASDATNSVEIFLLPFRIANTIRTEVKLCRYSPTNWRESLITARQTNVENTTSNRTLLSASHLLNGSRWFLANFNTPVELFEGFLFPFCLGMFQSWKVISIDDVLVFWVTCEILRHNKEWTKANLTWKVACLVFCPRPSVSFRTPEVSCLYCSSSKGLTREWKRVRTHSVDNTTLWRLMKMKLKKGHISLLLHFL